MASRSTPIAGLHKVIVVIENGKAVTAFAPPHLGHMRVDVIDLDIPDDKVQTENQRRLIDLEMIWVRIA